MAIWITCDGFLNWGKYCGAELDKNLAATRTTTVPAERAKLCTNAAAICLADRPELVLYYFKWPWGVNRKVGGFVPNPDGLIRLAGMKVVRRRDQISSRLNTRAGSRRIISMIHRQNHGA